MKYFIRLRLGDSQSSSDAPEEVARRAWDKNVAAYGLRKEAILSLLPPGAKQLASETLHDGCVVAAEREGEEVRLHVDCRNNPWGQTGWVDLQFSGVTKHHPHDLSALIEDVWLYEEIDWLGEGCLEYRVLLEGSEFKVVASGVEITETN